MKTVSPEERISLMYTAIASVTCKTTERERNSPSFDIILSKFVIIDLNKIKTDIQPTHVFPHNLQANTCFFFFLLKNIGVTVTLKKKKVLEDTALQGSLAFTTLQNT